MNAGDNNLRTLAGLISLDGWIADFDDNGLATVHVDLVFMEARFGAEPSDKIRFKIKVKRAELLLRVPDGEPLTIRKETVARSVDLATITKRTTQTDRQAIEGTASAQAGLQGVPNGSATASAKAEASHERTVQSEASETKGKFAIQHKSIKNGAGWDISSTDKQPMDGAPWDASSDVRLCVSRKAERNSDGCKPTLKLEVKCRREDIEILDLTVKDKTFGDKLLARKHKARHLAVAEQIIKQQIEKEGFIVSPDLSEPESVVLIADMLIMEQE